MFGRLGAGRVRGPQRNHRLEELVPLGAEVVLEGADLVEGLAKVGGRLQCWYAAAASVAEHSHISENKHTSGSATARTGIEDFSRPSPRWPDPDTAPAAPWCSRTSTGGPQDRGGGTKGAQGEGDRRGCAGRLVRVRRSRSRRCTERRRYISCGRGYVMPGCASRTRWATDY